MSIEIRAAVTDQHLSVLLRKAGVAKPIKDREQFRRTINDALHNFVISRYLDTTAPPRSAQLRHIRQIERSARRLLRAVDPQASETSKVAWREISRSCLQFQSQVGALFGSIEGASILEGTKRIRSSIALLAQLSKAAESRLAPAVKKAATTKVRHHTDKQMKDLFGDLLSAWLFGFGEAPKMGSARTPGPFVVFVLALFKTYANELSSVENKAIQKAGRELLKIKAGAVRERYRKSGVRKVSAAVKSEFK